MIARVWRGSTTVANAKAYGRHFTERVRPELGRIAGHRGSLLLRREEDAAATTEFLVVTFWDSMRAVKAFAGPEPDRAVVEPAARAVLADFDESVRHYHVVADDRRPPRARQSGSGRGAGAARGRRGRSRKAVAPAKRRKAPDR